MKKISKYLVSVLLCLSLIVPFLFQSNVTFASSDFFHQGEGYQHGDYDTNAQQPTVFNWTRDSRFYGVNSNLYEKWKYQSPAGLGINDPVIAEDGTTIIGTYGTSYGNKILAINPDGTLKWEYSLNDHYKLYGTPVIANDGYVYFVSNYFIFGININTGMSKWSTYLNLNLVKLESLTIGSDGTLYMISGDKKFVAFDLSTLSVKWIIDLGYQISQPAIDKNGDIYVQNVYGQNATLTAIKPDGSIKWSKEFDRNTSTLGIRHGAPVLDEQGNLYFVSRKSKILYSIKTDDGNLNWSIPLTGELYATPALDENEKTLYIGTSESVSKLYAINLDGTIKWQSNLPSATYNSPIVDKKGDIFINSGWILNVFSKSGEKLWQHDTESGYGNNNVAIGKDGTLYFSNSKSIFAISGDIAGSSSEEPIEGQGLHAEYFNNADLSDKKIERIDANIDFDWGLGSPDPLVDPETYSVRWTGKIEPKFTGTHVFFINSDDGARLWINDELIIDHWENQGNGEVTGKIFLEYGKKYDIKLEYYNSETNGRVQLSWSDSDYMYKEVVPSTVFYLN